MELVTEFINQLINDCRVVHLKRKCNRKTDWSAFSSFCFQMFVSLRFEFPWTMIYRTTTSVILYIYPVDPNLYFHHKTNSVLERFVWGINGILLYLHQILYFQFISYVSSMSDSCITSTVTDTANSWIAKSYQVAVWISFKFHLWLTLKFRWIVGNKFIRISDLFFLNVLMLPIGNLIFLTEFTLINQECYINFSNSCYWVKIDLLNWLLFYS